MSFEAGTDPISTAMAHVRRTKGYIVASVSVFSKCVNLVVNRVGLFYFPDGGPHKAILALVIKDLGYSLASR